MVTLYAILFDSVLVQTRLGVNVAVDVGIHDGYSRPLGFLAMLAERLAAPPTLFVGVRCSIATIMSRRDADGAVPRPSATT